MSEKWNRNDLIQPHGAGALQHASWEISNSFLNLAIGSASAFLPENDSTVTLWYKIIFAPGSSGCSLFFSHIETQEKRFVCLFMPL